MHADAIGWGPSLTEPGATFPSCPPWAAPICPSGDGRSLRLVHRISPDCRMPRESDPIYGVSAACQKTMPSNPDPTAAHYRPKPDLRCRTREGLLCGQNRRCSSGCLLTQHPLTGGCPAMQRYHETGLSKPLRRSHLELSIRYGQFQQTRCGIEPLSDPKILTTNSFE